MEEQLNLEWHEINSEIISQQPMTPAVIENKKFRKSNAVIVFWILIFLLFGWALIVWLTDQSTYSDDAGIATIWVFVILELIFMFKIIWAYLTTITIWEDSLIYRKWVLFRHKTETPYLQISSVESNSFLWMWSIEITLLNNNSFKYKHVQNYEEAESLINERVKQSRLKVQVAQPMLY